MAGMGHLDVLVRIVLKIPKTTPAIVIVLCSTPELDGKTVLLNTPYTLVTGRRENQVGTKLSGSSCWLTFIVLENLCRLMGERGAVPYPAGNITSSMAQYDYR